MKKCLNCQKSVRDEDVYCRNCGLLLRSNKYYIFINTMIVLVSVTILFLILLFIASYFLFNN